MELMDSLEQRSTDGIKIAVRWSHDEDDDVTKEFVEDIAADYQNLDLVLIPNLDC
jgi:tagatose-1,6-bisphosphate aldolase